MLRIGERRRIVVRPFHGYGVAVQTHLVQVDAEKRVRRQANGRQITQRDFRLRIEGAANFFRVRSVG